MARHVVLLRGINLVRHNRIAMPELRAALGADGFRDVMTYVQSGNVVLSSRASPERLAKRVNAVIKQRLGLDIVVLVRSDDELAEVVRRIRSGTSRPIRVAISSPFYRMSFRM